jgi:hypothetical protein
LRLEHRYLRVFQRRSSPRHLRKLDREAKPESAFAEYALAAQEAVTTTASPSGASTTFNPQASANSRV